MNLDHLDEFLSATLYNRHILHLKTINLEMNITTKSIKIKHFSLGNNIQCNLIVEWKYFKYSIKCNNARLRNPPKFRIVCIEYIQPHLNIAINKNVQQIVKTYTCILSE